MSDAERDVYAELDDWSWMDLAREVGRLSAELAGVRAKWAETRSADIDVIAELRADLTRAWECGDKLAFATDALCRAPFDVGRGVAARDAWSAWNEFRESTLPEGACSACLLPHGDAPCGWSGRESS